MKNVKISELKDLAKRIHGDIEDRGFEFDVNTSGEKYFSRSIRGMFSASAREEYIGWITLYVKKNEGKYYFKIVLTNWMYEDVFYTEYDILKQKEIEKIYQEIYCIVKTWPLISFKFPSFYY